MNKLAIVVVAVAFPFVAGAKSAGVGTDLSGCYDIDAATVSGMETSATSNQCVFSMTLRESGVPKKPQLATITGIESGVVSETDGEVVIHYTLTDFLRTGQMQLVGHFGAPPQVVDTCIADDGSEQPVIQYTITVVPTSGTGRFAGLQPEGTMTFIGTVEYCGYHEDFAVVSGGTICF